MQFGYKSDILRMNKIIIVALCIFCIVSAIPSEDVFKNKTILEKLINDDIDEDSDRKLIYGQAELGGFHSALKPGVSSLHHGVSNNGNCPACICNVQNQLPVVPPPAVPSIPNPSGQVPLYKLCCWNTLTWENAVIKNELPNTCNLNFGSNYIVQNNVPTAIAIHGNRVFVGIRRDSMGVYSTLNYFNINDIQAGQCPPLKPYPSLQMNELVSSCCSNTPERIVNVDRFNIDKCVNNPKLWLVDLQGLFLDDSPIELGEPRLKVISLNNDQLIRNVIIPKELYFKFALGITTIIPNVLNPNGDCTDAYGYIIDQYNGYIIVYSWQNDRFWRFNAPEFFGDLTQGRFTIRTPFGSISQYSYETMIHDGFYVESDGIFVFHSKTSNKEHAIGLSTLHNPNKACKLDASDIRYLGEKNPKGRTGTAKMNQQTGTVYAIEEEFHSLICGTIKVQLTPDIIHFVVSDPVRLPFLADMDMVNGNVYLLSNNYRGIVTDGFRSNYENFCINYVRESDVRVQVPQCYI